MQRIEHDAPAGAPHDDSLTLPFALRQKSRLRARLDSGQEVAVFLTRGRVLRDGDRLCTDSGRVVLVRAAPEEVSTATADNPRTLARAAYHLGNRHIPVQVGVDFIRYGHDHVLDDMLRSLGIAVRTESAAFEPEGGAYGHEHAGHSHDAASDHAHPHTDDHHHTHGRHVGHDHK